MIFPMEGITYLQIGILFLFVCMLIQGSKEGFVLKLFDLIANVLAILISFHYAPVIADKIVLLPEDIFAFGFHEGLEETLFLYTNHILVGFVIWVCICIIFTLMKVFFRFINKIPVLGSVNRFFGCFLGIVHAYLITVVIAYLFSTPLCINGNEVLQESKLIYIYESADVLYDTMQNQYETYTSLKKEKIYKEDPYGNIRIFFDMYDIKKDTQNALIEVLKMRSE